MGKLVVLNVRLLAYALLEDRYKFFNLHANSKGAGGGFFRKIKLLLKFQKFQPD